MCREPEPQQCTFEQLALIYLAPGLLRFVFKRSTNCSNLPELNLGWNLVVREGVLSIHSSSRRFALDSIQVITLYAFDEHMLHSSKSYNHYF